MSIPSVPVCRTKEILDLPKEESLKKAYHIVISYDEEREKGFFESIFSALFLWFDPNYFTVKKKYESPIHLKNATLSDIRFKVIPTNSKDKTIEIVEKTRLIFLGQNVKAESIQYTISEKPVRTQVYRIPYTKLSQEVQNFASVITDSLNLSRSYEESDIEFMKEHAIPTLLAARDELIVKSEEYERSYDASTLPPKEFVISTKIVPGHESKSIKLDTSSLEPTSFIRRRLEAGDVFSVKLKADGTFVFSIPTEPIPLGGLKKVKLKIISSIDEPNTFKEIAKASIQPSMRSREKKVLSFDTEMRQLGSLLPPSAKPILHKRFIDVSTDGSERFVKAYFEPAVDALVELERIERIPRFSFEEATSIIREQFNFIEDLVTQVNELHTIRGVVHHDIKIENLLILNSTTPGERRRLQLNDFEFCRPVGAVVDGRKLGTPGYYIEGLPGDLEKDKYATGIVIEQILGVMASIIDKIHTEDTRRLFLIEQLTDQIIKNCTIISRQLSKVYNDDEGKPYCYGNVLTHLNDGTRDCVLHQIRSAKEYIIANFSKYLTMSQDDVCSEYVSTQLNLEGKMFPKSDIEFEQSKNRLKELVDELTDLPELNKRTLYAKLFDELTTNYQVYQTAIQTVLHLDRTQGEMPNTEEGLRSFLRLAYAYIREHFSTLGETEQERIDDLVNRILRSRLY
jgi:serine/threonine protein kinase